MESFSRSRESFVGNTQPNGSGCNGAAADFDVSKLRSKSGVDAIDQKVSKTSKFCEKYCIGLAKATTQIVMGKATKNAKICIGIMKKIYATI